jgi:hypothetical protein
MGSENPPDDTIIAHSRGKPHSSLAGVQGLFSLPFPNPRGNLPAPAAGREAAGSGREAKLKLTPPARADILEICPSL